MEREMEKEKEKDTEKETSEAKVRQSVLSCLVWMGFIALKIKIPLYVH